jgi:hypothetical protein
MENPAAAIAAAAGDPNLILVQPAVRITVVEPVPPPAIGAVLVVPDRRTKEGRAAVKLLAKEAADAKKTASAAPSSRAGTSARIIAARAARAAKEAELTSAALAANEAVVVEEIDPNSQAAVLVCSILDGGAESTHPQNFFIFGCLTP